MKLSLRFVIPLALAIAAIAYAVTPVADALIYRWFVRDLEARPSTMAAALQPEAILPALQSGSRPKATATLDSFVAKEKILALGFCDLGHRLIYKSSRFPSAVSCERARPSGAENRSYHLVFRPIADAAGRPQGELLLVLDVGFVHERIAMAKEYLFWLFAAVAAVVSGITVLIAHLSLSGWVNGIRSLIRGGGLVTRPSVRMSDPGLDPIARDLKGLVRDLESGRRSRHDDDQDSAWSPRRLKTVLRDELHGDEILIVSNREPYIHEKNEDGSIAVRTPESGLVTALEPVMRACSGTWIAHGSGSADRLAVDAWDRVRVPPENPSYQIRRVWLSESELSGYYFGFANEGIWPLCHIAHTKPTFRAADWEQYKLVNQRFADAVASEAKTPDPVVLVQDYHFALLPKMIKERLPRATVISFWHIPWPNPESFGICPWREALLDGMLGSDILGFHTRTHCNNFLESVDRYVQSRIDRDNSTIAYGHHLTSVNAYPISIEFPSHWMKGQKPVKDCRARVRERNGMAPDQMLGVGVDRLDYTKGILERFRAVERLFELEPKWIGRFSFLQIAAPSRSVIDQYQHFERQVRELAAKINDRFGTADYQPICLRVEPVQPPEVFELFRAAELCFVSSLHDGMNLVAKEFVASRDDERGTLVLSQFAGAAKELAEALIVNPYDADQCAAALSAALQMPESEQQSRIRKMRQRLQDNNVYRWAARLLIDAGRLRDRGRFLRKSHSRLGEVTPLPPASSTAS